jgi:DNA repair protein RadC
MKIKDIPENNRPRERLERNGAEALSDAELLSIIINTGTKEHNSIDLSNRILKKFGINKFSRINPSEIMTISGIGKAKALRIIAAVEFAKRVKDKKKISKITGAKDVYNYLKHKTSNMDKEHFIVILLDTKNKIIRDEIISIGTINSAIVHPREVFRNAIRENSNAIILAHNHPSGNPTPSENDIRITEQIIRAGRILDIKLLDHVIIGKDKYWSWNDNK